MKFVMSIKQVLVRKISKEIKNTDRQVKIMTKEELETRIEQLKHDNKQLKSKYWVLTNGTMYQFCGFKEDCFCIVNRRMMNQNAK